MKKLVSKFGSVCRKIGGTAAVLLIFLMPASRSVFGEIANSGLKFAGQKSLLAAHGEPEQERRGGNRNHTRSNHSASCPSTGSAISPVRNSSSASTRSNHSHRSRPADNRPAAK